MDSIAAEKSAPPPMTLGRYTPFARLGRGGMAEVFLALARGPMGFNKLTVVKRLRNSGEDTHVQMFLDEARLAARLNHPNIVHTYEVGEVKGTFFIAMEYLEGQSVRQLALKLAARNEGLSEPLVAYISSLALKGLHHAHELCDFDGTQLGVVHRDVSPQNLFVTYSGEVKLLDFGIAKARGNSTHTETGVLKGKVRYMAPEQVTGKSVDRRLDIFSFGVVMWELLARRPLFEGEPVTILTRIASNECPPVSSVQADVSPDLDAIVGAALRRDPNDRYASADAMRADLEQFLRGHDPAQLEKELAQLMNELFAETRDEVRQRIRTFLAQASTEESSSSHVGLTTSGELPVLLSTESGPVVINRASLLDSPSTAPPLLPPLLPSAPPESLTRGRLVIVSSIGLVAATAIAAITFGLTRSAPSTSAASMVRPAPTTAHVHIETTPPGARIEWNGRALDDTPADVTLMAGPQTLILRRDGYETTPLAIDTTPGESIARSLELHALPTAAPSPAPSPVAPALPAPAVQTPIARGWAPAPRPTATVATPAAPTTPSTPAPAAPSARPKIRVLDDSESP